MEKVDVFLTLYNSLNDYLEQNAGQASSFVDRLEALAPKHRIIRQNIAKLKDYRDLRNILVHRHDPNGGIIAIPTEQALQEFEQIVQTLVSPSKLIPQFQRDIHLFFPSDPLAIALRYMGDNDYSQVVVQAEKNFSLLTVEGIARWLEEQAKDEIIDIKDAHIEDAQKHERAENVSFMNRNQTADDALSTFRLAIEQKRPRIYALLITERGKLTEKPLGIVTPWDLLPFANP
jgi:hypothetical protein